MDPFQGPRVGSCLALESELSEEVRRLVLTKQEVLLRRVTQVDCSATWLADPGFMVVGLVSGLSLANHSGPGSFLVVHTSIVQPRWIPVRRILGRRMDWHLPLTFPGLLQLVVAC